MHMRHSLTAAVLLLASSLDSAAQPMKAPKGGKLILKNLTPQVGEVLNITGMANLFTIE